MGSYTELYLDNYPVLSSKSYVIPEAMTIFRETDKRVYKRNSSKRNPLIWGDIDDNGEAETTYEYSTTVSKVIDRLEIMGFTLSKVEQEFKDKLEEIIDEMENDNSEFMEEIYKEHIETLKKVNVQSFISGFSEIKAKKLMQYNFEAEKHKGLSPIVSYMLSSDNELFLGFPCNNLRSFLRVFLESCPNDSLVIQDITEVVNAGYYNPEDAVCELEINSLIEDFDVNSKIIVLTEGSSDKDILERSLKLLYPHLHGYYSFMDFGISNASGGASALVTQIKSFVGVGIANRVIAIFDNDTTAYSAVRGLSKTTLRRNIIVSHYPKIEIAKNYPTQGPSGIVNLDVNGLACSIEMYLGRDVLIDGDVFVPVQWKGYDSSQNKYQGELINKAAIQKRFFTKLSECEKSSKRIEDYDWSGIRSILDVLFSAFHGQSRTKQSS